jgi:hypothetical protein
MFLQNLPTKNILDPIFYHTLFYDFRPVISPGLETIIALSTLTYIVESNLNELHLMNEHVFNDFIDQ